MEEIGHTKSSSKDKALAPCAGVRHAGQQGAGPRREGDKMRTTSRVQAEEATQCKRPAEHGTVRSMRGSTRAAAMGGGNMFLKLPDEYKEKEDKALVHLDVDDDNDGSEEGEEGEEEYEEEEDDNHFQAGRRAPTRVLPHRVARNKKTKPEVVDLVSEDEEADVGAIDKGTTSGATPANTKQDMSVPRPWPQQQARGKQQDARRALSPAALPYPGSETEDMEAAEMPATSKAASLLRGSSSRLTAGHQQQLVAANPLADVVDSALGMLAARPLAARPVLEEPPHQEIEVPPAAPQQMQVDVQPATTGDQQQTATPDQQQIAATDQQPAPMEVAAAAAAAAAADQQASDPAALGVVKQIDAAGQTDDSMQHLTGQQPATSSKQDRAKKRVHGRVAHNKAGPSKPAGVQKPRAARSMIHRCSAAIASGVRSVGRVFSYAGRELLYSGCRILIWELYLRPGMLPAEYPAQQQEMWQP